MDPETLPADERSRSAREFPCPYCRVEAGKRCKTSSGDYYKEWTYVHIDRLITMYRDAFVNSPEREQERWRVGYEAGRAAGWSDGAQDARYTFENTPIFRGCREEESLKGAMEAAGVQPASSAESEIAVPLGEQEVPTLRAVPKED